MPCDTLYREMLAAERAKVDTAIERLAKLLAQGLAKVTTNPVTGQPMISGWIAPKGMSDLCCLARAQEYAREGNSSLAMKANWQSALRANPDLKADFVHAHNHAHGIGHKH
jgi:hypothetical protein